MIKTLRLMTVLTLALAAWYSTTATVAAEPVVNPRQHVEGSYPDQICDIPVQFSYSSDTHFVAVRRGNDGRPYWTINIHDDYSFTNPDNGKALTWKADYTKNDLQWTDNPDGTRSLFWVSAGAPTRLKGPDGKVILLEAGAIGHEWVYQGPRPIEFNIIRGPNGRNDWDTVDFCAAVADALG